MGANTPFPCAVYIGLPTNPQFLGPQDPEALAARILASRGPSGENREYLYMLGEALGGLRAGKDGRGGDEAGDGSGGSGERADALDGVDDVDEHVADLVHRVWALEQEEQAREGRAAGIADTDGQLEGVKGSRDGERATGHGGGGVR